MSTSRIRAELQPSAQLQGPEHRTSFLQGSYTQARRVFASLCLKHYHLLALHILASSAVQLMALSDHSWALDRDWERRRLINTNQSTNKDGTKMPRRKKPHMMPLLKRWITRGTGTNACKLKHTEVNSALLLPHSTILCSFSPASSAAPQPHSELLQLPNPARTNWPRSITAAWEAVSLRTTPLDERKL